MKFVVTLVLGFCASSLMAEDTVLSNDESITLDSDVVIANESKSNRGGIWLLGAQYGQQGSLYHNTDEEQGPMPMLAYLGQHFFWKGYELGYQLNPMGSPSNMAFSIEAMAYEVDLGDSDDEDMSLLDERKASVMASFLYQTGPFEIKLSQDVSNQHKGFSLGLGVKHKYDFAPFDVELVAGFAYQDKNLSHHLYGVSQSESDSTSNNIAAYDAGASQLLRMGVTVNYALTPKATLGFEIGRSDYFGIDDSPIVDTDHTIGSKASFIYLF
jgi:outer membrane protein